MKTITFLTFLYFMVLSVSAEETTTWIVPGNKLEGKKTPILKVKTGSPNLLVQPAVTESRLSLHIWDGKEKFGKPAIVIKNGDVTYTRARLYLDIPLADAKAVVEAKPLQVLAFSNTGDNYEISLVFNANSELPDVVVTKK